MSQSARNKISNAFRKAKRGVLFTTDVSARGLDYPDISVVVQYGAPDTIEGYLHRLGRTGRAGNPGKGVLVLLPFERSMMKKINQHNIKKDNELAHMVDGLTSTGVDTILFEPRDSVRNGDKTLFPAAEKAVLSLLAYLMARNKPLSLNQTLTINFAFDFAKSLGLDKLPPLSDETVSKLKLNQIVKTKGNGTNRRNMEEKD